MSSRACSRRERHTAPTISKLRTRKIRSAEFWQGDNLVIVIDRSIFAYFSKKMGHAMSEVDLFALFPPVTDFKAEFANAALRDRFNQGLDGLCGNGGYAKLLDRYDVVFPLPTVCP